nr:MAG TPA: hypothetical protein [Caudoviricetes sp.]
MILQAKNPELPGFFVSPHLSLRVTASIDLPYVIIPKQNEKINIL